MERARFARDLHDGVLQTLAGTVFELESLRRQLPETSPVRERLLDIQMLNVALVNAARHAGGSRLAVELGIEHGAVRIVVSDNGQGFPFQGQYDLKALDLMGLGPVTLRHRLRALGGNLVIDSTPSGTRVEMVLPLAADGNGH